MIFWVFVPSDTNCFQFGTSSQICQAKDVTTCMIYMYINYYLIAIFLCQKILREFSYSAFYLSLFLILRLCQVIEIATNERHVDNNSSQRCFFRFIFCGVFFVPSDRNCCQSGTGSQLSQAKDVTIYMICINHYSSFLCIPISMKLTLSSSFH